MKDKEFKDKLMALVFPIAIQQFMLALVSASDALMLGFISQDALSAVSLAGQVTFVENLFLGAMNLGFSMFAAQYWGKKDNKTIERLFAYVVKITAIVTLVFTLLAFLIPNGIMKIFTRDETLITLGAAYLRWVALSLLLSGISQMYLGLLKNTGRAKKASLISSVSVVINIVLNALLIFGCLGLPRLEIIGAALATVLSKVIELLWCVIETLKHDIVKLKFSNLKHVDKGLKQDFWKYTRAVLGNQMVWGLGFTMYSVIMGHLGNDAVAANSIANVVKNLVACFCLGLGSGGSILVGNELGAGNTAKAKQYGDYLIKISLLSGAISGLFLLTISPLILQIASLNATAAYYLKWMLVMCSYYLIGKSFNSATVAGIFTAGGDSRFGFYCDVVTLWLVTIPLGFCAAFVLNWPVLAVYFIVNLDEIIKMPAVYRHYKKYLWVRDLTTDTVIKGEIKADNSTVKVGVEEQHSQELAGKENINDSEEN